MEDLYSSTPIRKALAGACGEEIMRVLKLFDIAYMLVKEELPFSKYSAVIEVEKRHGVTHTIQSISAKNLCGSLARQSEMKSYAHLCKLTISPS